MPREPALSLSQLLLIGSYYLEQDLNILQIHLQSSTCAGYLKYEFWVLLLEMPGQLLFLTFNTGTDRTTLSQPEHFYSYQSDSFLEGILNEKEIL